MRLFVIALSLVLTSGACGGDRATKSPAVPFQPATSSALLNYFGGYVSVYATESRTDAIGYAHPPRTLYLVTSLRGAMTGDFTLVDAEASRLGGGQASLRVVEHVFLPHLYVVESGKVRLEQVARPGALPSFTVHIEATLVDPLEGTRVRFDGDFETAAAGIT